MEKERKGTEAGEMLQRLSRLSGIKKRKLSRYLEQKARLLPYEERALAGAREGHDYAPFALKATVWPLVRAFLSGLPLFLGSILSFVGQSFWPMMGIDSSIGDLICEIILLAYLAYAGYRSARRFLLAPGVRKEELVFEGGFAIVGLAYSILMLQSVLTNYPLAYERQVGFYLSTATMAGYSAIILQLMSYVYLLIYNMSKDQK